ncbi:MAG: SiaC family regulatory phosphoprotein [Flavobacteriales bacterium]|nr:SiaC family regulatory phosphoprotein [Flavobacteriales bacterium]
MEETDIFINPTSNSPQVELRPKDGFIRISGVSISYEGVSILEQFLNSIGNYFKTPLRMTHVEIELNYFNTKSALALYNILMLLETHNKSGDSAVDVIWIAESDDEVLQEAADDYQSIFPDLPIKKVIVKALAA